VNSPLRHMVFPRYSLHLVTQDNIFSGLVENATTVVVRVVFLANVLISLCWFELWLHHETEEYRYLSLARMCPSRT
jgi:hypothetical protein